jgi:conjugal transfer pilus assembly protein TraE
MEEINKIISNVSNARQRNFFAACLGICLIANFLLALKISATNQKIIMIPGITREMSVDDHGVSRSYLEESALLYTSALLDLTPNTIESKKELVLKHVSKRSIESLKSLKKYFAKTETSYKKFKMSTFFAPKKMHVNAELLEVVVEGMLVSNFGKRGIEEKSVKYKISFDYSAHHLYLKGFVQIKEDKEDE